MLYTVEQAMKAGAAKGPTAYQGVPHMERPQVRSVAADMHLNSKHNTPQSATLAFRVSLSTPGSVCVPEAGSCAGSWQLRLSANLSAHPSLQLHKNKNESTHDPRETVSVFLPESGQLPARPFDRAFLSQQLGLPQAPNSAQV